MKTTMIFMAVLSMTIICCLSGRDQLYAQVDFEVAFPNLNFTRPVDLQHPNDDSNRLFVVEQRGIIYTFENNRDVNLKNIFLDIRERVNNSGNEQGLLGLAFHPDYQNNGYFYVDYTAANPNRTVVSRYQVSVSNPDSALKDSEFVILEVDQPYSNHNAGQIVFGPDGYLYITLGDGGSGGDPEGNGQNLEILLGSILRIDVDRTEADLNYGIPPDNPLVANLRGFRDEIYAYGLRNPWRISFDPETHRLWAADVGQSAYEEIDIIEKGKNYGWNIMEGFHCYNSASCDTADLTLPIREYSHSVGQSITGGYVYRGSEVPELTGRYIYADYISGRIWTLEYDGTGEAVNSLLDDTDLGISSFGVDRNNELYICAFDGRIYRFKSTSTGVPGESDLKRTGDFHLMQNYPNPFNSSTTIQYHLETDTKVILEIYNTTGRLIKRLVNGNQPQGDRTVIWYGDNMENNHVSSGVYLYRLRGAGFDETKKLLILN